MLKKRFINVFACAFSLLFSIADAAPGPISTGIWVKLRIPTEGVYKLEYADLQAAGFDLNALNTASIQLRGHQCGMLPETNGLHEGGLPQIPIWVEDGGDGKFNLGDFLLFYAGSNTKWSLNRNTGYFEHTKNFYSDEGYLYLGVGSDPGLRIQTLPEVTIAPTFTHNDYYALKFHDSDIFNPAEMGRTWLGERLGNEGLERNFELALPSDGADSAYVKVSYAGAMVNEAGSISITVNGKKNSQGFSPLNKDFEDFRMATFSGMHAAPADKVSVKMELVRPNIQSLAWMDFIEVNQLRPAQTNNGPVVLRHPSYFVTTALVETRIAGSNPFVWEISNERIPAAIPAKNAGSYTYFRTFGSNKGKAFVAFSVANCLKPGIVGALENADILAGDPADFIIISHPDFKNAASELAEFRRTNNGLKVKVVSPASIYKEYSCGMQDVVAIRDYLRDEYQKAASLGGKLKYVLLMGTTSYDMKNRVQGNTNFIPSYHLNSYYKSQTFCLDDFFAFLDTIHGNPADGKSIMKVAIGRIPCRTQSEANGVVQKLKRYASPLSLGPWRTELAFVCDDVDDKWEREFVDESEKYSIEIDQEHSDLLINKVYADAYKQQSTGNTEKYPDVSNAITRYMNNGVLLLNYQGHGGEKGWAQEGVLTVPMINNWENPYRMPVLFTATCEFSRFDNPHLQSGGELALLNANGGAIALLTTTRLVYVSGNSQINNDFWTQYGFPDAGDPVPTVGEIYQRMKNRPSTTSEDNKFALLGDPSMRLQFPEHAVVLDSINGKDAQAFSDTMKAFSVVRLKGHIEARTGGKMTDFNGNLWVKFFDKPQTRYTLDNDQNNIKIPFKDQTSYIFKGEVSVIGGDFQIVFSVPKDIAYNVARGKLYLYAHNNVTDASGSGHFLVGGSESSISPDEMGPVVRLFMNDTLFRNGGDVESNALFLAKVYDPSGINATGAGIGRDMTVTLDPGTDAETSFTVNDYFSYDLNSYRRGLVQFPLEGLTFGKHVIRFKIWDIHNNSTEREITCVVLDPDAFRISESKAYPNPFQDGVTLSFTHNLAGNDVIAAIRIFDAQGRRLVERDQQLTEITSTESRLQWDGTIENGYTVENGMYLFQVELTTADGRKASFSGKIIKQ